MAERILEFSDSRGLTLNVDREQGIIRGVKILGLESKNGRTYPKETAARAVGLYEGVKVNVNHPKGNPSGPRDYQDRLGALHNVRLEHGAGGIRGDFHFNPKHALAEQLLWDAEHAPENVGFSHNVEATVNRRGAKQVVEEINRVHSVDLVADPATTRGLFEETTTEGKDFEVEIDQLTEAELRAKRPDLMKTICEAALAEHSESEAVKAKDAELKSLKEEVENLTAEKAKLDLAARIEKELVESKLPQAAVTDLFRSQLAEAKDDDARKALIEDRRKLAASGGSRPKSQEQNVTEEAVPEVKDGKSFVRAIT